MFLFQYSGIIALVLLIIMKTNAKFKTLYYKYVYDTNINYESGGDISMKISAPSNTAYKYYYSFYMYHQ